MPPSLRNVGDVAFLEAAHPTNTVTVHVRVSED